MQRHGALCVLRVREAGQEGLTRIEVPALLRATEVAESGELPNRERPNDERRSGFFHFLSLDIVPIPGPASPRRPVNTARKGLHAPPWLLPKAAQPRQPTPD